MASDTLIQFYDIASAPPHRCYAPNPWKTRYALNFKRVQYKTEWIELPDVTSVRKSLGAPPCRFWPDGSEFYTLPVIKNTKTGEVVGDSFEIAQYLDKICPDTPYLLPASTTALTAAFNAQVDAAFTNSILLMAHGIPFNPATADISKAEFARRAGFGGLEGWQHLTVSGEERVKALATFQAALGELAKFYKYGSGSFLQGDGPMYADFVLGAWLQMLKATTKEWEDIKTWHDGLWGRIDAALEPWAAMT